MSKKSNSTLVLSDSNAVALVYRYSTPTAITLAKNLTVWLKERGYKVYTAPEQKRLPQTVICKQSQLEKCALIIAIGGDGTYLRAVRLLENQKVPILGVNLGTLGFLTPTVAEDAYSAIDYTLSNRMRLSPRSMIQIELRRKGSLKYSSSALNDVVIERGTLSQLINLAIYSEKYLVSEIKADGLIIATPTGSTAYNLAAGGPILHPEVSAWVIAPISPHSLTTRPMIMPDHKRLAFKLVGSSQKAHLVVDGQKVFDLNADDEILIHRQNADHLMVRDPNYNYFHLLREKLKFGERS